VDTTHLCVVGLPVQTRAQLARVLAEYGFRVLDACPDRPAGEARVQVTGTVTPRQAEVLRALYQHGTALGAAQALGISCRTVNSHLSGIYKRLGMHDRTKVLCWACRYGLLEAPSLE